MFAWRRRVLLQRHVLEWRCQERGRSGWQVWEEYLFDVDGLFPDTRSITLFMAVKLKQERRTTQIWYVDSDQYSLSQSEPGGSSSVPCRVSWGLGTLYYDSHEILSAIFTDFWALRWNHDWQNWLVLYFGLCHRECHPLLVFLNSPCIATEWRYVNRSGRTGE